MKPISLLAATFALLLTLALAVVRVADAPPAHEEHLFATGDAGAPPPPPDPDSKPSPTLPLPPPRLASLTQFHNVDVARRQRR